MSASLSLVSPRPRAPRAGREPALADRLRRLEQRCARERAAREEAERILEAKSLELFELNQHLLHLNNDLEARVAARTASLAKAKKAAVDLLETDHLTKLSSRYRFHQQMRRSFEHAAAGHGRVALMLIDIDRFKAINDTYGHDYGDQLLVQVAARISAASRRRDHVSRLGGDELAILLNDSGADDAETVAQRVLECFKAAFTIQGVTIQCTASIGIACFPEHANSPEELQRAADLALYKAKVEGRGRSAAFTHRLLEDHDLRHWREAELKHSIESCEVEVWYQPIVDLRTGRPRAVEALARMKGRGGEYLPPDVFIPLAEEIGLIHDLGRQVLQRSVGRAREWVDAGLIDKISVNVSADEFLAPNFVEEVLEALAAANMSGDRLVLEITESVMMARLDVAGGIMNRLKERGVAFALDDFGCGYSNLAYLRQLPITTVKLDQSLLSDVEDAKAQAIVRYVVALCRELGIVTVCEGVETIAQLDFIRSIGCDHAQGYLLGRPTPGEMTAESLQEQRASAISTVASFR